MAPTANRTMPTRANVAMSVWPIMVLPPSLSWPAGNARSQRALWPLRLAAAVITGAVYNSRPAPIVAHEQSRSKVRSWPVRWRPPRAALHAILLCSAGRAGRGWPWPGGRPGKNWLAPAIGGKMGKPYLAPSEYFGAPRLASPPGEGRNTPPRTETHRL